MKKILMLGIAALMSVSMMAQRSERPDMAQVAQRRAEQLSKTLELKDETKAQFEALYVKYATELNTERNERRRSEDNRQADSKEKKDKKEELTAEQASEQLHQFIEEQERQLSEQKRRLEVQKRYITEFQKLLTPQQVLKIMQTGGNGQRQRQGQNMNGPRMGGMGGMRGMQGGQREGFGAPQGNDNDF